MPVILVFGSVFFLALLGFGIQFVGIVKENEQLKNEIKEANAMIERQNKAIDEIALDTAEYACSLDSLNDYASAKYEKIIHEHEDDSCENKLKSLEEALDIFKEK